MKVVAKLFRALLLPFAFAVVWLSRRTKRPIRFGEFNCQRLGHMVGNSECYLCERDTGMQPDTIDIWLSVPGHRANRVIERKYKKLLRVWPAWVSQTIYAVNSVFPQPLNHLVLNSQVDRDIHGLWKTHGPHIGFTFSERRRGENLLLDLGMPLDAKWVCLIVRDATYLQRHFPEANFSYHDYRDADISEYLPAVVELMRRGYYIVRMGDTVAKHMNVKHSKIIDYALNGRTEFGDLYLGAHCAFCLGTPTGFMAIPQAFNRPVAVTDMVPLGYSPTWSDGLMIWKHHVKDGKRMSLREIFEADLGLATLGPLFQKAGVTLENNTSQEIFDVAMEMADRVEGKVDDTPQPAFWDNFPQLVANGGPVNKVTRIRIGREFLKGYQ